MNTIFHKLTHDRVFTTFILIIFAFFAIVSITTFFKNRSMHYFGRVTQISSEHVVIADKKFGMRTFVISPNTNFRLGPQKTQEIKVGQEVFIVGKAVGQEDIQALEIRIFDPKQ